MSARFGAPWRPCSPMPGVELDVADVVAVLDRGQARAVDTHGTANRHAVEHSARSKVRDVRDEDRLDRSDVLEAGLLEGASHVRPRVRDAVHARGRKGAIGVPMRAPPRVERGQAGGHQVARDVVVAAPVRLGRPEQEPLELAGTPEVGLDVVVRAVPEQVGGTDDPPALLRDEGEPFGDPRIDDELARLPLELVQDRVDRHGHPGHHGGDVGVHERRQLDPVVTAEAAHLDRGHVANLTSGAALRGRHRNGRPLPVRRNDDATTSTRPHDPDVHFRPREATESR